MQLFFIRLRVRWLAWRYRRLCERRRALRAAVMTITDEQAKLWYKGEQICSQKGRESR